MSITAPVGPGQTNDAADVRFVQEALVRHRRWLDGLPPPQVSGRFDPATAAAIVNFQRVAAALRVQDGIVSPRGYTIRALALDTIPGPQHRIFQVATLNHENDTLTAANFQAAATTLSCEVAAIQAVAETEAAGSPWDAQGRPRILYERHKFHRHSSGLFSATHPDISSASRGGYGRESVQYEKLRRAAMLNEQAALKAASWGLFQILGENHVDAGHATVDSFVTAMMNSRADHLNAFVAFVNANRGMKKAIQDKDWTTFASLYNGPAYAENDYDGKMKRAYERLVPPTPAPRPANR